jgi:hypothetical protein
VVLRADPERLEALEGLLEAQGVPFRAIREVDPPYNGQLMALGLQPARKDRLKRYVSSLPLLR